MNRSRTAAVSLTALLALGGTTTATAGMAAAQTEPTSPTTSTTVAAPSTPTDVTITLPGLGDIALSVDSSTGAVLSIVVAPIDGVTVSDPVAVHNGVLLDFTLADGTVRSLVVEVRARDGAIRVEVEPADEDEDDDHVHGGPPPVEERGDSADHRNDDGRGNGQHLGTSTTVDDGPQTSDSSALRSPEDRQDQDQGRPGRRSSSGDRNGNDD